MQSTVAVIGTIFLDCKGFAQKTYHPAGRNLGSIKFVHGGVGRNVAENMANLGIKTIFVSSVDKSGLGQEVLTRLTAAKVNIDYILESDARGMGMWIAIMNASGDLAGSVSQMPDLVYLENYITEKGAEFIRLSDHVILEMDLNEHITRKIIQLAKEYNKPVYGIPGNLAVVLSNMELLKGVDCFVCNDVEAERLIGVTGLANQTSEEAQAQLEKFVLKTGLRSMVVTLGAKGCVYFDADSHDSGYQPIYPVTVIDTSGAGDAFFSGTVMGLIHKRSLAEAVVFGTKIASWTIQSDENTRQDLQAKMIEDEIFQCVLE